MAVSKKRKTAMQSLIKAQHAADPSVLRNYVETYKPKTGAQMRTSFDAETAQLRKAHEAKQGAKHKKIQAQVNKHLKESTAAFDRADAHLAKRTRHQQERISARMQTDVALVSAEKHAAKAATLKKPLPQGYAMVFGKLRKINPKAARKGAALLKR